MKNQFRPFLTLTYVVLLLVAEIAEKPPGQAKWIWFTALLLGGVSATLFSEGWQWRDFENDKMPDGFMYRWIFGAVCLAASVAIGYISQLAT